ncbi:MAG TPA: BatD family protein [Flavisolibacter sp.]|nr:BatD family protein [Flavisolibacter sp.]
MKWLFGILLMLLTTAGLQAQRIRTIVPQQPVVVGNAFQVQYVINEPADIAGYKTPYFEGMSIVSGPNTYKGTVWEEGKSRQIENVAYTLVPISTGKLKLSGLVINLRNGSEEKGPDATVQVVSKAPASFMSQSSYTDVNLYAPSDREDLEKLISENLFIKASVDRTSCYLGEPVVATFTLYSRLQSTSEVINAPSLYGFGVMDMLSTKEAHQAIKTVGNKVFNTSVLRKLQLFPEQTGVLTIDPMQLQNTIEFDDPENKGTKRVIEKLLVSQALNISVKPLPSAKPDDYTGAVGRFEISASLSPGKESTGEGRLVVRVTGRGNFSQFAPPQINWPKGLEVFEPEINDTLDKGLSPVQGSREYSYRFVASKAATYPIPAVYFSYFDPAAGSYRTGRTNALSFTSGAAAPKTRLVSLEEEKNDTGGQWKWVIPAFAAMAILLYFIYRKKPGKAGKTPTSPPALPSYAERIQSIDTSGAAGKKTCLDIQRIITEFMKQHPGLSDADRQLVQSLHKDCELFIYSSVEAEGEKQALKKRAYELMQKLEA